MDNEAAIERIIKLTRPHAKFIGISHSDKFIETDNSLGNFFYYVSVYDERIDSNVINTPYGIIILHNTYLSSFAYNLFLCMLYVQNTEGHCLMTSEPLRSLLKHNFKKFFAEQLLHNFNNIFSRAVFLETLLYEQQIMTPIIERRKQDKDFDEKVEFASQIMSGIISTHELGHFYLNDSNSFWERYLESSPSGLSDFFKQIEPLYPTVFLEEVKCDAIAVISTLYDKTLREKYSLAFLCQILTFGYAAYAVMISLVKSAQVTSLEHKKIKDKVNFTSVEKEHRDYTYTLGFDKDFEERAKLMIEFCRIAAAAENIDLYAPTDDITLSDTLLSDMMTFMDIIMVSDDQNARNMSLLVAESLHQHQEGVNFLYLRSKIFSSRRKL